MIAEVGVAGNVERYSIKYVNLIEAPSVAKQIAKINLDLRIGSLEVTDDHIDVKVHHVEKDTIHIQTVITSANARMPDGREAFGVVLEVDSIRNIQPTPFEEFASGLTEPLETLRQSNKEKFFDCLKRRNNC